MITRLPPGPEPEVPFVDQVRAAPQYACPCGARREYAGGVTGRCGCIKTHSTGGTWTDADLVPPELPEEILEQLEALSDDDLQRLTARTRLRPYKLILLREAGRRRRARLREGELASTR